MSTEVDTARLKLEADEVTARLADARPDLIARPGDTPEPAVAGLPPTATREQLAAGFDLARQLRDPDFRARLTAAGVGPDNPIVVVLPDDTITAILQRLDEPGPALIAIPDDTDPHGYRLLTITRHAHPDDGAAR